MARLSKRPKLSIMVSSTVYGQEDLLDQIYALLTGFGYDVLMSHKGTIAVISTEHAFKSSLNAVDNCDLFLGLISTHYGSGTLAGALSITHQEFLRAIEINKPRWFLAHDHVVTSRLLLRSLGHKKPLERAALNYKGHSPIDDLRLIDMYEAAIRQDIAEVMDRTGNWVQKYVSDDDALLFASSQFHRYQEIEQFLKEQFSDPDAVRDAAVKVPSDDR